MDSGDIYLNTVLGDLWIATGGELARINDPKIRANPDEVEGFVLVGHADVTTKKSTKPSQITEVETKMTSITFDEALEEIASKSDEYRAVIEDAIRAANAEEIPDADDIICTEASPASLGIR